MQRTTSTDDKNACSFFFYKCISSFILFMFICISCPFFLSPSPSIDAASVELWLRPSDDLLIRLFSTRC